MSRERTMSIYDVKSGDLLAWSKNPYNTFSNLLIRAVAFFTKQRFGHVGIAWRSHDGINDELFVVEATLPAIHLSRVTEDRYFYCIPMTVDWNDHNKKFLMSKIGLGYSIADALRAYFGTKLADDNRYQCAELCHEFYQVSGIQLPEELTPGELVNNAMKYCRVPVYRVVV